VAHVDVAAFDQLRHSAVEQRQERVRMPSTSASVSDVMMAVAQLCRR
jgi:hypothetical protein